MNSRSTKPPGTVTVWWLVVHQKHADGVTYEQSTANHSTVNCYPTVVLLSCRADYTAYIIVSVTVSWSSTIKEIQELTAREALIDHAGIILRIIGNEGIMLK